MSNFQVSANGQVFGVYEGQTEQDARDACAIDAGYKSEADMVNQVGLSELVAEPFSKSEDDLVSALKTAAMAMDLAGLVPGDAYWQQQCRAASRQARAALAASTGRPS